MNKVTCLSLLSNAVLVWNTVHMMRIIKQLRASGETITEDELVRMSPLAFSPIIPNGTYFSRYPPLERERDHNEHEHPYDMEMSADL
jgi:Tn3 transposase DDE domain